MAVHALTSHFAYFFSRINPSPTFQELASSEYNTIKGLIENRNGPAAVLSPKCFLQGSYRRETAIHSINDVDIVVLCELWYPGTPGLGSRTWDRDAILDTVAAPLLVDNRYKQKTRYNSSSMCIKVDLQIKVEILPVVYKQGNNSADLEPFCLYRPEKQAWEDGYARYHQQALTDKNSGQSTNGNFIPMVKVLKHICKRFQLNVVSFHLECLLFNLSNWLFIGNPAQYIPAVLSAIASKSAVHWYGSGMMTPCCERYVFTNSEWCPDTWASFHATITQLSEVAIQAGNMADRNDAIRCWQALLGDDFFPTTVS